MSDNIEKPINKCAKDQSISLLRFFAMAAIISCHICQAQGIWAAWWLNVGVQVFLLISGFLYGQRAGVARCFAWLVRRFKKIWIPFAIAATGILVADVLSGVVTVSVRDVLLGLTCIRSGHIPNGAHLWYVSVALLCYLITPVLYTMRTRFGIASLLVPLATLAVLGGYIVPSGFWTVVYIVGFILGSMIRDRAEDERSVMGGGALFSGACAIGLTGLVALGWLDFQIDSIGYVLMHMALGVLCFCLVRWILKCSSFRPGIVLRNILKFSDTYSYEIYLTHQVLILGAFSVFKIPGIPLWAAVLICLCWSLLSGVLLHRIADMIEKVLSKVRS